MNSEKQKRALFIDRDGIFNEIVYRDGAIHSPRNWNEVVHYPMDALAEIKNLGFLLIMVTNQPDIERKIVAESFLNELHGYYKKEYSLDAVYVCPFSSNEHPMKKPNPGMFLQAAKDFDIDLSKSFHLGDTNRDVEAASRCGAKSILWKRSYNQDTPADYKVSSLLEVKKILNYA